MRLESCRPVSPAPDFHRSGHPSEIVAAERNPNGCGAAPGVTLEGLKKLLVFLLVLVALDQLILYTAFADGFFLGRWVAPFDPPLFTEAQEDYLQRIRVALANGDGPGEASLFDPELGWCPPKNHTEGLYEHDWAGCRVGSAPLTRTRAGDVKRVVTIGGSFTLGAEVAGPESWVARLDEHEGIEFANLGVSGFGIDQALLRLRRDGAPLQPDEVWLGLMPSAIERITTQFPPISAHWSSVAAFKPLFLLDEAGVLELVPSPVQSFADYDRLLSDQAALFAALSDSDTWVRRCPPAFEPRGSSWSHWSAATRLALTWKESGGRDPAGFLADGHPVRDLTRALLAELERNAEELGATLRIVVVPARSDLERARADGSRYWAGLVQELVARGVPVLDASDALVAAGALEDDGFWMPGNHYSPSANAVVAEAVSAGWFQAH